MEGTHEPIRAIVLPAGKLGSVGSKPSFSTWLQGVLEQGILTASVNNRNMSTSLPLNWDGNCGPGPVDHGCRSFLREDGYSVPLTAFCLKHGQDKGLRKGKGKGKSTAESAGGKEGEGKRLKQAPRSGQETSCDKESFTGAASAPNCREAAPEQH